MWHQGLFRRFVACLASLSLALAGCGGGGTGGEQDEAMDARDSAQGINLGQQVFKPGDVIDISQLVQTADAASLTVKIKGVAKEVPMPILSGKYVVIPLVTKDMLAAGGAVKVKFKGAVKFKADVAFKWHEIPTTKPGLTSLLYIDASLKHLNSAYEEILSIAESNTPAEAQLLADEIATLLAMRTAISASMADVPQNFITTSRYKVDFDATFLEVNDQFFMAMINASKQMTGVAPAAVTLNPKVTGGGAVDPAISALPGAGMLAAASFTIPSVNCAGLADQADRAWCANISTQIASDLIIAYTGLAGTVGGFLIGAIGTVAVVLGGAAATPYLLAGLVLAGLVATVNMIAGSVQGASAYGTGTSQGTNVSDNIANIRSTLAGALSQIVNQILPGTSQLLTALRGAIMDFVVDKYLNDLVELIKRMTKPVVNCIASASAGNTGTFVRIYDFGAPTAVQLDYNAFTIPDAFDLYDGNGVTVSTGGLVSGAGVLGLASSTRTVTVKVRAPDPQTGWTYTIGCR